MAFNPSSKEKIFEIIFESEKVADQILVNKHELLQLDKTRQSNREAIRELGKLEDKNTWITVGSMLIKMERNEAIEVLKKGTDYSKFFLNNSKIHHSFYFRSRNRRKGDQ
jgi:chaperonin cofactor prefoldin